MEIPALLHRHRKDFISTSEGTRESEDMALLQYLKAKLPPHGKGAEIEKYLEALESKDKKFSLKIAPLSEQLTLGYDFSSCSKQGSPRGSPKSNLKPKLVELQTPDKSQPSYAFTEETLSFVEKHSAVLAALVHLLCPPINKGIQSIENSTQTIKTRETTKDTADKVPAVGQVSPPSRSRSTLTKSPSNVAPLLGTESESNTHLGLEAVLERFATLPALQRHLKFRLAPFLCTAVASGGDVSDMRQLALVAGGSSVLGDACVNLLQSLLQEGRVADAVKLLRTEPVISSPGKVQFMKDLVVSTRFAGLCSLKSASDSGTGDLGHGNVPSKSALVSLLFQISDPSLAARLVMSSLHGWSAAMAVFLIEYCVSHLPLPSSSLLHTLLAKKLDILRLNQQIMERFSGGGEKRAQKDGEEGGGGWKNWADLEQESCRRPKHVLELMLEAGLSIDLIQQWAAEHKLGWEVTKVMMGLGLKVYNGLGIRECTLHWSEMEQSNVHGRGGGGGGGQDRCQFTCVRKIHECVCENVCCVHGGGVWGIYGVCARFCCVCVCVCCMCLCGVKQVLIPQTPTRSKSVLPTSFRGLKARHPHLSRLTRLVCVPTHKYM